MVGNTSENLKNNPQGFYFRSDRDHAELRDAGALGAQGDPSGDQNTHWEFREPGEKSAPLFLSAVRQELHAQGLADATHQVGVRQGPAFPVPVLPPQVQEEAPLAQTHPPTAQRLHWGYGELSSLLQATSSVQIIFPCINYFF